MNICKIYQSTQCNLEELNQKIYIILQGKAGTVNIKNLIFQFFFDQKLPFVQSIHDH